MFVDCGISLGSALADKGLRLLHAECSRRGGGGRSFPIIGHRNPRVFFENLARDADTVKGRQRIAELARGSSLEEWERLLAETNRHIANVKPTHRATRLEDAKQRLDDLRRRNAESLAPNWGTCAHEAGHALCCVAFNFRGLSIARAIKTTGELGSVTCRGLIDETPLNVLAMVLAGPINEAWAKGLSTDDGRLHSDGDLNIARMAMEQCKGRDAQLTMYRSAKVLACDTLRKHASAADAIARELSVRGWLDRDELLRIVRSN